MKIRKATVRDAGLLCDYLSAIQTESPPTLYRRKSVPTIDEERQFIANANRNGVLFVCTDGRVLGMIGATIPGHAQRKHVCEFGMSVLQEHRGQGIGTRLLMRLISWSEEQRLLRIECAAFDNNRTALRLYKRLGFVIEGRRRGAIEINGAYRDIIELGRPVGSGFQLQRNCP